MINENTFIVSDETVNGFGYIILTSGIDTTRFEKNPVMLYMHERKTVVGKWENIRKDGKKLLADAVFDDTTPIGKQVKEQVEKGFLRSASIGVDIIKEEIINGVKTVTECELFEISIVDVPSNSNALKLYKKNGRKLLRLSLHVEDLRTAIIELLGLDKNVSDDDIIAEIQSLVNIPDNTETQVCLDIKNGYIESASKKDFLTMAKISPTTYNSFIASERSKREKAVEMTIKKAIDEQRITTHDKELYKHIGLELGNETIVRLFEKIPKPIRIIETLKPNRDKKNWSLEDYRRYAPQELKDNPELYAMLLKKENNPLKN